MGIELRVEHSRFLYQRRLCGILFAASVFFYAPLVSASTIGTNITTNILISSGLKITSGAANNFILISDASGNASWVSVGSALAAATSSSPTFAGLTLTAPLSVSNGGTGQTTALASFNALSPLTTKGDIVVHNGVDNIRIGVGSNGQVLTASSTATSGLAWTTLPSTGTVMSVNATGSTTGLVFTGGPITDAGTLTLGGTLGLANGGTDATTPAGARSNLGLVIGTNIEAWSANLDQWSLFTTTTKANAGANSDITSLSGLSTALSIGQGGTGGTTAIAGFDALSPLSTKGDLLLHNGTHNIRVSIGSDGQVLTASSTATSGVAWMNPVSGFSDPMTTRGDVMIRDAGNATTRLGIGTNGQVLHSNGTDIAWASLIPADVGLGNVSNALQLVAANNLSDLTSTSSARTNLGFTGGTGITISGTGAIGFTSNALSQFTNDAGYVTSTNGALLATNNLSDLTTTSTARANIGLGNVQNVDQTNAANITSGTLSLSHGGTGQTTALASFNALSPLTTKGDLIAHSGANNTRVAVGSDGQVLTASSSVSSGLAWTTPAGGTVTSVAGSGGTTGLTLTGGPITGSGTLTIGGTLILANGGTGAGTASGARTNLGLAIGTNVQAWSSNLDQWSLFATTTKANSGANSDITSLAGLSTALSVGQGGTGGTTFTSKGILFGNDTSAIGVTAAGSAGQVLQSNGASSPTYSTPTYPSASGSAGKILRSDGTNNIYSTATFADTYTASNLLYANGTNTVQGLATTNNGVLITSSGGVPSISTTIPSATQDNITRLGTIAAYNGTATVENGVPYTVKSVSATAQAANISATTIYSSAPAGRYRMCVVATVTQAGSISSTLPSTNLIYTDPNDSVVKTIQIAPTASANTTATGSTGCGIVNVKNSTNIQYSTSGYLSVLAGMQYDLYVTVEAL